MNKPTLAAAAVALAMITGTAALYNGADGNSDLAFRSAEVTRASLRATVSATGTLNAVRTVQVGTQASGQISKIFADFNDRVTKGQLIATIDPILQQQAVEDAGAQVERAEATLSLARSEYDRSKELYDAKVLSASEFNATQSNFSVQQASVKSARIALDRARQNLSYTSIYAPISGVVVERNVDVGQTVAASLSAPQLFLIANDLSEMEILVAVDEGDIGAIKDSLPARFTVQAFPNQRFNGVVRQVRLQSATVENVVSYTAVVTVRNVDGRLRPGMTATVEFETASAENVLAVPNAALRITPTDDMRARAGIVADTAGAPAAGRGSAGRQRTAGAERMATLWVTDSSGSISAIRVRTGVSDGQKTEVAAAELREGMTVITGLPAGAAPAEQSATSNPLAPQAQGARRF